MNYLQVLALIKKTEGTRNLHDSIVLLISISADLWSQVWTSVWQARQEYSNISTHFIALESFYVNPVLRLLLYTVKNNTANQGL